MSNEYKQYYDLLVENVNKKYFPKFITYSIYYDTHSIDFKLKNNIVAQFLIFLIFMVIGGVIICILELTLSSKKKKRADREDKINNQIENNENGENNPDINNNDEEDEKNKKMNNKISLVQKKIKQLNNAKKNSNSRISQIQNTLLNKLKDALAAQMYKNQVKKYKKCTTESNLNYLKINYFIRVFQVFLIEIVFFSCKSFVDYFNYSYKSNTEFEGVTFDFHSKNNLYNNNDYDSFTFQKNIEAVEFSKNLNLKYNDYNTFYTIKIVDLQNYIYVKPSIGELVISSFLLILFILFPLIISKILDKRRNNLLAPQFVIKYGSFYSSYRTISKHIFAMIMMYFQIMFAIIGSAFSLFSSIQLLLFIILISFKIYFISQIMPFNKSAKIFSESISEILVLCILVASFILQFVEKLNDNIIVRSIIFSFLGLIILFRSIRCVMDTIHRMINISNIIIVNKNDEDIDFQKELELLDVEEEKTRKSKILDKNSYMNVDIDSKSNINNKKSNLKKQSNTDKVDNECYDSNESEESN